MAMMVVTPYATNCPVLRLSCLSRQTSKKRDKVDSPKTMQIIPRLFLPVATPHHAVKPPRLYARPYSGKYLMNRMETGIATKATRAKTRRTAVIQFGSDSTISTINTSPEALNQRLKATSGKSDHTILMAQ